MEVCVDEMDTLMLRSRDNITGYEVRQLLNKVAPGFTELAAMNEEMLGLLRIKLKVRNDAWKAEVDVRKAGVEAPAEAPKTEPLEDGELSSEDIDGGPASVASVGHH